VSKQLSEEGSSFGIYNPATGEQCGTAPDCSRRDLDDAVDAAEAALSDWATNEMLRREGLLACASRLRSHSTELADLLTMEQGKPSREAKAEVAMGVEWFEYFANLDVTTQNLRDDARGRIQTTYEPFGIVGAITPWNFPLSTACWKAAPALRAGNTMVLKPSPYTPLTTMFLEKLMSEVLPASVFNVVTGGDQLGAWLITHPKIKKISLTGSIDTGKAVALAAAADLTRVTLELGGNDPAILLDDVEPEKLARALFWAAFYNCGQVCTAVKRVYVPDSVYERTVGALAEVANSMKVGDGTLPATKVGPINNRAQFERVQRLAELAEADGATMAAGGRPVEGEDSRRGYFFPPTIVADARGGMQVVDDEQFGPILPLIRYASLDDALAQANATQFGLGGSVWSSDLSRAHEVALSLDCGTVWINGHGLLPPEQPFGGHKLSGVGLENGLEGLMQFLQVKVIHEVRHPAS
jgi:acyl-CoA reductase-like NAD-dependent aldehyde dehydrogenase